MREKKDSFIDELIPRSPLLIVDMITKLNNQSIMNDQS